MIASHEKVIRKMVSESLNKNKQYKVFDSKYYYSAYKDILFVGDYDECVEFIIQNGEQNLEMCPVEIEEISENLITEGNLAIIGSRSFNNYTHARKEILNIIQNNKISITKIISGGASGADKIAEIFASKFNIPIEVINSKY